MFKLNFFVTQFVLFRLLRRLQRLAMTLISVTVRHCEARSTKAIQNLIPLFLSKLTIPFISLHYYNLSFNIPKALPLGWVIKSVKNFAKVKNIFDKKIYLSTTAR